MVTSHNLSSNLISYLFKTSKMKFDEVKQGLVFRAFILVDIRSVDEVKANGKIPGSVNIPRKLLL